MSDETIESAGQLDSEQATTQETTTPEQTATPEAAPAATETPAAAQAFTPNFKVKVMDNEYEVDEWLRPTVTDAEKEKRIRELYEKSYAMDHYKNKYSNLESQHKPLSEKASKYEQAYGALKEAIDNGDVDTINHILGIDDQKYWNFVKKKLDYLEMSPEQRADLDARRRERMEMGQVQTQFQTLQQQYQNTLWNMKQMEIRQVMSRPEITEAAKEIDARLGQKGAFLSRVVEEGQREFQRTKQDISAEEAVIRVLRMAGISPANTGSATQARVVAPVIQRNLKTLPNVSGTANSPVKSKISSIDDLKKIAQERYGV